MRTGKYFLSAIFGLSAWALLVPVVGGAAPAPTGQGNRSLTENALFSNMDGAARRVRSVSAQLAYTTVTVLVNDRSTQVGVLYYRKGHRPEVLIQFSGADGKEILFRRGTGEIYYPKMNQVQEYDLARHQNLLQQFLLLGFGTETSQLESSYELHYLGEKRLGNYMTALLELAPLDKDVKAQLKKIDLWVSEENWMPIQQQFFERSGDYLIARYSNLKVNPRMSPSVFKIKAPGAERLKMN